MMGGIPFIIVFRVIGLTVSYLTLGEILSHLFIK